MKLFHCFIISLLLLILLPFTACGADLDLKITEIMYNPVGTNTNRQWIEIKNTGNSVVQLQGGYGAGKWRIEDGAGCHFLIEPALNGELSVQPGHYFVIVNFKNFNDFLSEYPNFDTNIIRAAIKLKSTTPDFIKLIKLPEASTNCNDGTIIDQVYYSNEWGAGASNENNKSLEKINLEGPNNDSNWKESLLEGGTPGEQNSVDSSVFPFLESSPDNTLPQNQGEEDISEQNSEDSNQEPQNADATENNPEIILESVESDWPDDIIINEFLADPFGSDAEGEWIELFNQGEKHIDLSNWQIDDKEGCSNPYTFPEGTFISPKSFLVLSRLTTKIAINNENDAVRLLCPNGEIIDQIHFSGKAPEGQSYTRTENGWEWNEIPTPGSANIIKTVQDSFLNNQTYFNDILTGNQKLQTEINSSLNENYSEPNTNLLNSENPKSIPNQSNVLKQNASLYQNIPLKYFPIFIALGLALSSGILIFIFRKKQV